MITIFWTFKKSGEGYLISFWSDRYRTNELTFKAVNVHEEKIRRKITDVTGKTRFTLEQLRGDE